MQIAGRNMYTVVLVAVLAGGLALGFARDAFAQAYPQPTPPRTTPPLIQPLQLMSPFPVVRIVGRLSPRGARIRVLSVRAPATATIIVRCFRRRCRRSSLTEARGFSRAVRFRRFERRFVSGTIIEVAVGRPGAIGKYTRFRIRRGRRPARMDACLRPGETRGTPCPEV